MKYTTTAVAAIGLIGGAVFATMSPANLQDTGNSLARQAFDIKDLVLAINSTMNSGPMQDVFEEIDDMYEAVLANIQLIIGTPALTQESQDVQLVYEAYSYLAQAMFELMDALGGSATNFITMDNQNEFRVPASVREVGGVVDAWMFNMIGLFPANSSYSDEAANQKNQVDSHFRRAIASYHLATAQTETPYGNITNVVSGDALSMSNSTDSANVTNTSSSNDGQSSDIMGTSANSGSSNDIRTASSDTTAGNTDASPSNTDGSNANGTSDVEGASTDSSITGSSTNNASTNEASAAGASSNGASTNGASANTSSNTSSTTSNTSAASSDGSSVDQLTTNTITANKCSEDLECSEAPARK